MDQTERIPLPPPPPPPIPWSPQSAEKGRTDRLDPMQALFAEIRSRADRVNKRNEVSRDTEDVISQDTESTEDEDSRKRLAREIQAAARKRAAKGIIMEDMVEQKQQKETYQSNLFGDIKKGNVLKRASKGNEGKIERFKVQGMRCGPYMERIDRPVDGIDVFRSMEECEEKRLYNVAIEAILNTVLKYGNEINEADDRVRNLTELMEKEKMRLVRSVANNDAENIRNYKKSVASYEKDIAASDSKKVAAQASYDRYFTFLTKYVIGELEKRKKSDVVDFYRHLKRNKPSLESWTVEYVAQEFANYFRKSLPGYDVGGVSGLTSAQVRESLLNSPLSPYITDEVLSSIMSSLGVKDFVETAVKDEEDEEWFDAPMGDVQRTLYDMPRERLWRSTGDVREGSMKTGLNKWNSLMFGGGCGCSKNKFREVYS